MIDHELLESLAGLSMEPPAAIAGRIFARWAPVDSPIGPVRVAFTDRGVCYLRLADDETGTAGAFADAVRRRIVRPVQRADDAPPGLEQAISTGRLDTLALDLSTLSDFERVTLEAARHIPRGQTRPYSWIARRIHRPKAVRAVGNALGRNPVPLLIPCHRVTRHDGSLGGYVFGTENKRRLLDHEGLDVETQSDLARRGIRFVGSDVTRVVCFPSCDRVRLVQDSHRRLFRDLEQARSAGYRPCADCAPGPD
jgi:O-6-methylguanine DNA methyltransferase